MLVRSLSMNRPGWALYTPTFSAAGGGAAIGNGISEGIWRKAGDSVEIVQRITFGSTSTFGSGAFQTTLPNSIVRDPAKVLSTSNFVFGDCFLLDNSAHANDCQGMVFCAASSNLLTFTPTRLGTAGVVAATNPFTWVSVDALNINAVVPISGW